MPVLKAESRAQDQALEFLQWEDWKVRKNLAKAIGEIQKMPRGKKKRVF